MAGQRGHLVVALVASAGGIKAFDEVLGSWPSDSSATVIVLLHTVPDRESELPAILQRMCALPVGPAEGGAPLESGTVVVAPAGMQTLVTPQRRLSLVPSGPFPPNRPSADLLLTTLALAVGPDAVAVVLSGGGHDGATGATVVHKHGGTVIATDEATSEVFSMPQATIQRDSIHPRVVPVADVARVVAELRHP